MTRKNVARNALVTSIICMLLCVSMLVGTTFAWFTDEVKSGTNVIASGNLDIALYHSNINDTEEPVGTGTTLFDDVLLWEPGALTYENFKIVNEGTLALKYKMNLKVLNETVVNGHKLSEVIKVGIIKDGTFTATTRSGIISQVSSWTSLENFALNMNSIELPVNDSDTFGLVLYWQPNDDAVDNQYNVKETLKLDIGIELYATQAENESDSFGTDYDQLAVYPGTGMGNLPDDGNVVYVNVQNDKGQNVGSLNIPKEALADPEKPVEVIYSESNYTGNFTINEGEETLVVDVTVLNLKEDNTEPIMATLKITAGLDPASVKLYHYDEQISCTYNPNTGNVSFEVTSFSPFTVVFDAESEYAPPVVTPEDQKPAAEVVESPEYVNVELPWGSYGQWSPTAGLEANLEAAYTFSCTETLEEAMQNPYANWYCDFYVSLNKDLGANQIFLGGNYGSFGWVGFHNGDLTLDANTELPLLGSVTNNPWTYLDVVQNVGKFICGVGDVNDALAGATFTVMLRLTNPENADEFYNVSTTNYTFKNTTVNNAEDLKTGLANGENMKLSSDVAVSANMVMNGGSLDGKGNTVTVSTASNSDCAITTTGGTIRNLSVTGNPDHTRAIGPGSTGTYTLSQDLIIDKVNIDNVLYGINGSGNSNASVYVTNSVVYGWNSFSNIKLFSFDTCTLGKGNCSDGYFVVYGDTSFANCTFEGVFDMGAREEAAGATITFTNCNYDGVKVTAENFVEYFFYGAGDERDFGNLMRECTIIVDGVTVDNSAYISG